MTEKLDCPNRPKLCEFPRCDCYKDEGEKRSAEIARKRPFLLRMKTVTSGG